MPPLQLSILPDVLAVARLAPGAGVPVWAVGGGFVAAVRTATELSLVVPAEAVPEGVTAERNFRALVVDGTLDFALTGILAALAVPLAAAEVSIFAISTYDTDYVLVRSDRLETALGALRAAGHTVGSGG